MAPSPTSRSRARSVIEWFPFLAIVVAYIVLHELGDRLTPGAHIQPQLGFDRWLFGGTAPTVRLQRELWHPGDPRWWDYAAWLVYLSHFVVPLGVAIGLRLRDHPGFRRYRMLIVTGAFAGFVTYVAYPGIPPWLAGIRGDMPETVRVVREVWDHLGAPGIAEVFGENSKFAFAVGALPSLHAAAPFMVMLFFWARVGWPWRAILVAYTLGMAFTLVYSADHFVFDIVMGWLYAVAVYVLTAGGRAPSAGVRATARSLQRASRR